MSLHRRIFDISYRHRLTHVGSCITAVDIIDEVYSQRAPQDPFILSCGHAGLALYVVLEKYLGVNPEMLLAKHGIHPAKDVANGITCSSGSLGQGITVAVGHALANRSRNVWCLASDAEANEGAFYEAVRFADHQRLDNLRVYININGWGALQAIRKHEVCDMARRVNPNVQCRMTDFVASNREGRLIHVPFLVGQGAHYHQMVAADWAWVEANL